MISYADVERDITAVASRALVEDGHVGGDYVLTGPESLSQADRRRERFASGSRIMPPYFRNIQRVTKSERR